VQAIINPLAIR